MQYDPDPVQPIRPRPNGARLVGMNNIQPSTPGNEQAKTTWTRHPENDIAMQSTIPMKTLGNSFRLKIPSNGAEKETGSSTLKHLKESTEPERPDDGTTIAAMSVDNSWGWLPALSLTSAIGVFLVALAYNAGRVAAQYSDVLFWFGLLVLFLPIAGRLLSAGPTRRERIALLIVLGLGIYFAKFLQYPLYFAYHDEFVHWRTAQDIAASGHLFQENPLLPISSFYPGLEIITSALSSLTGFSLFASVIVILGVVRLVFVLALYLFYEHFSNSARVAGIATVLYMANPQFLFFGGMFAYESLALPLAVFVLFALTLRSGLPAGHNWGLTLAVYLGIGAVVITHHITSYALVAFLLLWTVTSFLRNHFHKDQGSPARAALLGLVLCAVWLVYTGYIVVDYLSPYLANAIIQIGQILTGKMASRPLFQDGAGFVAPLWERVMAFASVALIMLGLPFGLFQIWWRYRANPLALALASIVLLYPVSQVLRLTQAGAGAAGRAPEFLFLGIALILALAAIEFWPARVPSLRRSLMVIGAVAIILVGQLISGSLPSWARLPGPYLVSADERSIEPEGLTAAEWAYSYLGPGHRIASDRINTLLVSTYGSELAFTSAGENISVESVFTSLQFGPTEEMILKQDKIQYLVVDHRLSTALPRVGFYFNEAVSGGLQTRPIDPLALAKFDGVKNVNRIFDSGNIIIYDVEALTNPPAVTSTSKNSCMLASPTALSSSDPNVAKLYTGTIHDIPAGITTNISLIGIQQQLRSICGYFSVMPKKGLFNGISEKTLFMGTITTAKQIQFVLTSDTGQTSFYFDGSIQPDGTIGGTYCSPEGDNGKCSDYGLWSISPVKG